MPRHPGEQINFPFNNGGDRPRPEGRTSRRHARHQDAPPVLEQHPPAPSVDSKRGIVLEIPRPDDGLDDEPMWKH